MAARSWFLQQLGVEMLLEYLDLAGGPGFADPPVHRRNGVHDKPAQTFAGQLLCERRAQALGRALPEQGNETLGHFRPHGQRPVFAGRRGAGADLFGQGVEALLQRRRIQRQQRSRSKTLIDQALDEPQAHHLLVGVQAFAGLVAQGRGEAVTPLPDAQGVLAEPGIPRDGGDVLVPLRWIRIHATLSWTK